MPANVTITKIPRPTTGHPPAAVTHATSVAGHVPWPWGWTVLGGIAIIIALRLLMKTWRATRRGTPTRAQVDDEDRAGHGRSAIAIVALFELYAWYWWAENGKHLMDTITRNLTFLLDWWTKILKPEERTLIEIGAGALLLGALALAWLWKKLYFRAFFPDLLRLDVQDHPGMRPERIGRLYKQKPFIDQTAETAPDELKARVVKRRRLRVEYPRVWRFTIPRPWIETREIQTAPSPGATHVRLYYKHANRVFPLLRYDTLDVPIAKKPEPYGMGQLVVRVGRIERDPTGPRFRRRIASGSGAYDAQPLLDTFRTEEVAEDALRKVGIVLPGSSMNPEVARKKFQNEGLSTSFDIKKLRATIQRVRDNARERAQARDAPTPPAPLATPEAQP